jgi:hypothetical protein
MQWLIDNKDNIAIILSLASFVMSGIALFFNYQRTSIAVKENKAKQLEKKKAKIRIERTKVMGSKQLKDVLIIRNEGKATAENILIRLENKNGEVNPLYGAVPTTLGGGDSVKIDMYMDFETAPPYNVTITWDDENQKGNIYKTIIN